VQTSVDQFLDQTARRGTWYGGGSAAALSCALAAALLEKLASRSTAARPLRAMRTRCVGLVGQDAAAFSRVIRAKARRNRLAVQRALRAAIEIPAEVYASSQQLLKAASQIKQTIHPSYQVDLTCAVALAKASGQAARALVITNLAWLGDRAYSRQLHRKLSRLK